MSHDLTKILRRPIVTEKNMDRTEKRRQYTFEVDPSANKVEIRVAVEKMFKVRVTGVNTVNVAGKRKRHGFHFHTSGAMKKAVVTLAEGEKIEII